MDNQHRMIRGYRDLSAEEIAAMNAVKAKGEELAILLSEAARAGADSRWLDIATTQMQQGLMALTRAIAQPTTF